MTIDLPSNPKKGLAACYDAFDRLKTGKPIVAAHVGLLPGKITPGVVSFEAGFDRGYLKKSRSAHLALIAQIEAFRLQSELARDSKANEVRRARNKVAKVETELEQMQKQLYEVLTQNLQLVERVRELESELAKQAKGKVVSI
ncbi:hypothetical protein [Pseudomonas rubra]|uniref:Uncharacterized protein n=1 Tax=Pseudomonas rubra TaxID=2942627 RepID=A0ABT5PGJ7_9PSED|nr:hypothetical protein [Pseudomonas rubra]MDD1017347.1 hypothetical protein [Pseudomonas rubra]MDD1041607.1 hypothetical protein [Pseudomonas rubra]MDD1156936.1 hypothetical protein [Pseudomonas rubra]